MNGELTYVYLMNYWESGRGSLLKIGYSKDPKKRAQSLSCGPYRSAKILYTFPCKSRYYARSFEKILHKTFEKSHYNGELFYRTEEITEFLKEHQIPEKEILQIMARK